MKPANRVILCLTILLLAGTAFAQDVVKYVRYSRQGQESYGILEGETIRVLDGDIYTSAAKPTGATLRLSDVTLLPPSKPSKVIAVGLNYRSHIGNAEPAEYPGLFAKYPTSLIGHEANIVRPPDSENLHYEGELVVIIGRQAKNISPEDAPKYIFGVTAGNDVSERDWQRADLQWLRAKASDTFGPMGPAVVTGLDYRDLLVQTRVNGEVRQKESSNDLIFDVDTIVSYISRYVTLMPGDAIYTGTPGSTKAVVPGDVIEIEVEGVGILRNKVVAAEP